jgi:hypothetical protein
MLIEAGANVNTVNVYKNTVLHCAIQNGYDACVKTLIEAGAKLDINDVFRRTPLDIATKRGHAACVIILINKIVSERPLRPSELHVIPQTSAALGDVLRTTMRLHGRTEAAKITARLTVDARDTLRTAALCLNRTIFPRDLVDSVLVQCV